MTPVKRQSARGALRFALESLMCGATAGLAIFLARLVRSGPAAAALREWLFVWWMPLLLLGGGIVATGLLKALVRRRTGRSDQAT